MRPAAVPAAWRAPVAGAMDGVAAAALPAAVDVDDALSSGVVVNGRKLAAQQRLAAAAARLLWS